MGRSKRHDGQRESDGPAPPLWWSLLRLARPAQWTKSAFVLIGPLYGLRDLPAGSSISSIAVRAVLAAAAFALASSACYVANDIFDRVADRAHPRKRRRPIAAGRVSVAQAWAFAGVLAVASIALVPAVGPPTLGWTALALGLYVVNVSAYSAVLKHLLILDVICLALGFVLRVMGGCAATGIEPSAWLLNVTFFLSMFLAFGKRLGERKTLSGSGDNAAEHRRVQAGYTDSFLQMAVIVTAGATLLTYASYVQSLGRQHVVGFNLMWLTMLPAFYGMFRAILMLEQGKYDDPTELAVHDRGFQAAGAVFVLMTVVFLGRAGTGG